MLKKNGRADRTRRGSQNINVMREDIKMLLGLVVSILNRSTWFWCEIENSIRILEQKDGEGRATFWEISTVTISDRPEILLRLWVLNVEVYRWLKHDNEPNARSTQVVHNYLDLLIDGLVEKCPWFIDDLRPYMDAGGIID